MHQKAVFSRAKVSAHEVAKLVRRLDVTNMERLTTYLHSFVDGQFYGVELFPLHAAQNIESARKIFVCSCFDLPTHTSKNLTYALIPVMPALFLLLKRRASFYVRAQSHDLACVQEAFLFDMCQLFPHKESWTYQLLQLFRAIDVDIPDFATFPRHLTEFSDAMTDIESICFHCVSFCEDKTLSFFCNMPDVAHAASFRKFLTTCKAPKQIFFFIIFVLGFEMALFYHSQPWQPVPTLRGGILVLGTFFIVCLSACVHECTCLCCYDCTWGVG
jgi:hypothetical protein